MTPSSTMPPSHTISPGRVDHSSATSRNQTTVPAAASIGMSFVPRCGTLCRKDSLGRRLRYMPHRQFDASKKERGVAAPLRFVSWPRSDLFFEHGLAARLADLVDEGLQLLRRLLGEVADHIHHQE